MKPVIALMLLLRFVFEVLRSGIATAWLIVQPGRQVKPCLVRMPYENLDDWGVSLLACMLTLTPGTTAIDIDSERRELLIHLLDDSDIEGALAGIHQRFELPLRRLFPARRPA